MTIEANIVEALRNSQVAQLALRRTIDQERLHMAALRAKMAELEAQKAALETAAVNVVDPEALKPHLDALAGIIAESDATFAAPAGEPPSTSPAPEAAAEPRSRFSAQGWR